MATWRAMGLAAIGTMAVVVLLLVQGVGWAPVQAASGTVSDPNCNRNGLQAQISAPPAGGVITFNCASPLIAITQTLVITANTTLDGANGGNPIILDGGSVTRIISLTPGVALTLTNITLQRGNAGSGPSAHGGAVNGDHTTTVTLMSARVLTNTAGANGGGVRTGVAVFTNTQFVGNAATRGGGLFADGAATVSNTLFINNTVGQNGGGMRAATATVSGSSFLSNMAGQWGGGLYADGAATVTASSFVSNTAFLDGGGFFVSGAATVTASSFVSNTARFLGGGLLAGGAATVISSSFVSNTARADGGGLYAGSAATVMGSSFLSNTAARNGGGLYAFGAATVTASSFLSNTAQDGGGLVALTALTMTNSTLSANRAFWSGGAISLAANSLVSVALTYLTSMSNTAPDAAIAARVQQTPTIRGSVFQHGASSANCFRVTTPAPDGVAGSDTSCGNATTINPEDINLGPLADNGGGQFLDGSALLTHLPQPGSVLIGGMLGCVPGVTTDQRGVARPGAGCDVGALEVGRQPVYLSLSPNTAPAGSPTTVVTATGSGFIPGTVLLWNGSPRATTVLSATTLTATIPATDLASATVATTTLRYGADPTSVATTTLPFTVTLNSQTITFPNPGTQDPTSLPSSIPVTATASSGLPVSLTSQTTGVCTVSGFTVALLTGGTCTLVANQGGNAAFAPASPVTQSFTVNPVSQTITFPNPGTQNPASLPSNIPVTATATSGLQVTLSSQTATVCTISGFTVTLLTSGLCTLVANQGGNTVFAPASPVTQSFTVNAPSGGGGGGGGGTTLTGTGQIVIATGFRNQPLVQ